MLKKYIFSFILLAFLPGLKVNGQQYDGSDQWWHDRHPGEPFSFAGAKELSLIRVNGNKFVDDRGNTVLFRGMSISDPDKVEKNGQWNKQHFEKLNDWGVRIVRIPIHPVAYRQRGTEKYLTFIDQAVEWCTELNMYIIIDWHTIGNLKDELFQDPMYNTSMTETLNFWRTIARRYSGINTIAFYELFNEPTVFNGQLGRVSWDEWKVVNENMITIIRAFDKETIPLIAGFDWAYDLTPLHESPIEAENIAYVTHPYPHKRKPPYEPKWEADFGFAASKFPVVATEIGFTLGEMGMKENGVYGKAIIDYLENKGISWVAWVFDPEWHPQMLQSWENYAPTEQGEFFMDAFINQNNYHP